MIDQRQPMTRQEKQSLYIRVREMVRANPTAKAVRIMELLGSEAEGRVATIYAYVSDARLKLGLRQKKPRRSRARRKQVTPACTTPVASTPTKEEIDSYVNMILDVQANIANSPAKDIMLVTMDSVLTAIEQGMPTNLARKMLERLRQNPR